MASSLIATFKNANGETQSITFSNIDPETPNSDVKEFVAGVVSHSSNLLKVALTSAVEARIRTTTDTMVDLKA